MGIDDVGTFLNNMVGNVEKAIIRVVDDKDGDFGGTIKLESDGEAVSQALRGQMNTAYMSESFNRDTQISSIKGLASKLSSNDNIFNQGKMFKVQFNPATLQLHATGGGISEVKNFAKSQQEQDKTGKDIGVSYEALPFAVNMDVDLIFNKVEPNDAFIEIGQSLATFKGAYKTVANVIGKNASFSIQNEVEGLIAATRCFQTCLMSFNWGKLCYNGVLQNLSSNYTVFNPKGEPVAGTVHLSMILIDEYINEGSLGKWYKAYQEAFADPIKLSTAESVVGGGAFSNFTF